jgi:hypothetical protein
MKQSSYARARLKLMSSVWVDKSLRDEWARLEISFGRSLTLEELKWYIGYVTKDGCYVGPKKGKGNEEPGRIDGRAAPAEN